MLTPLLCFLLILFAQKHESVPVPIDPIPHVNPPQPQKKQPGDQVIWIDFKPIKNLKNSSWGEVLTDIENHLHPSMGTAYRHSDKDTWAHETTHGIHSWLNNNMSKGQNVYHLYVGKDKAAAIKKPKFKIENVANLIPKSMQQSRYNLYLVKQRGDWNNEPVYLWDEWVAYCNGAECGIELVKKGTYKPSKNDANWGVLEFGVYATYVAIAQQKYDPNYDNKQMLEFLAWNLDRGMKIYNEGQTLEVYNWDNGKYLKHLQTSGDAAEFRKFLTDSYGPEWTKKLLGTNE